METDDMYTFEKSACLIANNTGISTFFKEKVGEKYLKLKRK